MTARTLMIQGTSSDAGKSTLVTAICRLLHRGGWRVAPFKPQNMALNSAVTIDGGEIGRAQALQAQACGLPPTTDMNPVLLKPNSDVGAQVIVNGHAVGNMDAQTYHAYKPIAHEAVLAAHARLVASHEAVIVEGAGSPAEINLRDNDIANMGFAEAVDCPVLLVADIDRGGVFAQLVGTMALLSQSERTRIHGFVINRFRGDPALLDSGLRWLEAQCGVPVLGVLPWLQGLHLDAEDSIAPVSRSASIDHPLSIVVPVLPRISNHTDFDPLRHHPQVRFHYVPVGKTPPPSDLVILPGSKNVRDDLAWLRDQGWEEYLQRHLRYGGRLLGICGGFQMLGKRIEDPHGVEGAPGSCAGFGWLEIDTVLAKEKQLRRCNGRLLLDDPATVQGYEIHAGVSHGPALRRPLLELERGTDGAISDDGQILGTYLHGLFDSPAACTALLRWAGVKDAEATDVAQLREQSIDRLADAVEHHLDWPRILALLDDRRRPATGPSPS